MISLSFLPEIGGKKAGRIEMTLRADVAPKTVRTSQPSFLPPRRCVDACTTTWLVH